MTFIPEPIKPEMREAHCFLFRLKQRGLAPIKRSIACLLGCQRAVRCEREALVMRARPAQPHPDQLHRHRVLGHGAIATTDDAELARDVLDALLNEADSIKLHAAKKPIEYLEEARHANEGADILAHPAEGELGDATVTDRLQRTCSGPCVESAKLRQGRLRRHVRIRLPIAVSDCNCWRHAQRGVGLRNPRRPTLARELTVQWRWVRPTRADASPLHPLHQRE
mmetsp:Transcript_71030/g.197316  ORF Transcript_71030/g.197316 Transcript_71030/m.197316 type:complete len:224 (+) Transcript_71030:626-1297(+)